MARKRRWTVVFVPHGSEPSKIVEVSYGLIKMALGGVASIVFGALLVAFPGGGLISLVWLVGAWSVVFGVSSLSLAYRLHEIDAALPKPVQGAAAH